MPHVGLSKLLKFELLNSVNRYTATSEDHRHTKRFDCAWESINKRLCIVDKIRCIDIAIAFFRTSVKYKN